MPTENSPGSALPARVHKTSLERTAQDLLGYVGNPIRQVDEADLQQWTRSLTDAAGWWVGLMSKTEVGRSGHLPALK